MGKSRIHKKIRKYAELRGAKDFRINEKVLKMVWNKANTEDKKRFEKEMDTYFGLVKSGRIEAGESPISMYYNNRGGSESVGAEEEMSTRPSKVDDNEPAS